MLYDIDIININKDKAEKKTSICAILTPSVSQSKVVVMIFWKSTLHSLILLNKVMAANLTLTLIINRLVVFDMKGLTVNNTAATSVFCKVFNGLYQLLKATYWACDTLSDAVLSTATRCYHLLPSYYLSVCVCARADMSAGTEY